MRPTDSPGRIRTLLTLYRECHYDVAMAQGVATLRIGTAAPPAIADWLGAAPLGAFLTATNPHSQALKAPENRRRMDLLAAALDGIGARYLHGVGHIPGERWREPSLFVADADPAQLDALMQRFEQNSILTLARGGHVRLRLYRPDWHATLGNAADLDWAE